MFICNSKKAQGILSFVAATALYSGVQAAPVLDAAATAPALDSTTGLTVALPTTSTTPDSHSPTTDVTDVGGKPYAADKDTDILPEPITPVITTNQPKPKLEPCQAKAQKKIKSIKNNTQTLDISDLKAAKSSLDAFQSAGLQVVDVQPKLANDIVPDTSDCAPKPPKPPKWRYMTAQWRAYCSNPNVDCSVTIRHRKADNPHLVHHITQEVW